MIKYILSIRATKLREHSAEESFLSFANKGVNSVD